MTCSMFPASHIPNRLTSRGYDTVAEVTRCRGQGNQVSIVRSERKQMSKEERETDRTMPEPDKDARMARTMPQIMARSSRAYNTQTQIEVERNSQKNAARIFGSQSFLIWKRHTPSVSNLLTLFQRESLLQGVARLNSTQDVQRSARPLANNGIPIRS